MMEKAPSLTFLDLPDQARRLIYASSGLRRPCPIDLLSSRHDRPYDASSCMNADGRRGRFTVFDRVLLFESELQQDKCWHLHRLDGRRNLFQPGARLCKCPRLPLELLLVCRQVRDEALDVLLQTNEFVVRARPRHPEMLAPLLSAIPAAALVRMTRLLVRLNCWPCPEGHDEASLSNDPSRAGCRLCSTDTRRGDAVLSRSSRGSRLLLERWEQVCRRLGSGRCPTRQMSLTLICDVDPDDDGYITSRLVDPIQRYLAPLSSCTLRLGRRLGEQNLASIARVAALALTRDELLPDAKPFPFTRLPWEIQLRVLQYTHLGLEELAGYDHYYEQLQIVNGRRINGCYLNPTTSSIRKCCYKCTDTFIDWSVFSPSSFLSFHLAIVTSKELIQTTAAVPESMPPLLPNAPVASSRPLSSVSATTCIAPLSTHST